MAALEEHERFIREFLSKKENTVEDLADVLETTYSILSNEASIPEVSNVFLKKKGLQ